MGIGNLKKIVVDSDIYRNHIQAYYKTLIKPNIERKKELRPDIVHSFGDDNPDKTFFVIPNVGNATGTFEMWFQVAFQCLYAKSRGYLPIIDMKNYKAGGATGIAADKSVNYWEIYFRQPNHGFTLEEVYHSKNIVYGIETDCHSRAVGELDFLGDMSFWHSRLYHKVFQDIGYNDRICDTVKDLDLPANTVGIPIRRSFEWGNKMGMRLYTDYFGHHARGFIPDFISWIETALDKKSFDFFFVASDDRESVDILKREFGEKCLNYDRRLPHSFEDGKPIPLERRFTEFEGLSKEEIVIQMGTDYSAETYLLSKCKAILSNKCAQEWMARVISGNDVPLLENDIWLKMFE